ncbi:MAG: helical backbone metal receptor [Candidatus Thermoplasmatota archaeon]
MQRVVSLVPSWTETIAQVGASSALVGVTKWCTRPQALVSGIEKVGGTKDPNVTRIVAIAPDLVVCEKEENRREDVEAMRAAGLDVWVSDVRSVRDSVHWTRELGSAVGHAHAGAALATRIEEAARHVSSHVSRHMSVYVPIWRHPWMTLTRDTYAHSVLSIAGADNVFADAQGRYPERSPEDAIKAGAVAALLPTEPYPFHEKPAALDELVAAGFSPDTVRIVDGEALTWYGARAVNGMGAVGATIQAISGR